jgi:serine/threonine protein phosphatase PrpC
MRYAAASMAGAVRHENQDSLVIGPTLSAGAEGVVVEGDVDATSAGVLVAVIDGMGGHRGGREASTAVAQYLHGRAALHSNATALDSQSNTMAVQEMLTACDRLLHDEMDRRAELGGMGATIVGLACLPDATVVFNLGDARAYHHAGDYLQPSSEEHRAPTGGVLQSLGGTLDRVTLAPFVRTVPRVGEARWLLCSDGLSDFVPFLALQQATAEPDPGRVVRRLLSAAIDAGSDDNVSIIVVDT